MLVLSQYHIFESYKTNIYRVGRLYTCYTEKRKTKREKVRWTMASPYIFPAIQRGQCILFSVVFTLSLPHPPRQCLGPTCHLSTLN